MPDAPEVPVHIVVQLTEVELPVLAYRVADDGEPSDVRPPGGNDVIHRRPPLDWLCKIFPENNRTVI